MCWSVMVTVSCIASILTIVCSYCLCILTVCVPRVCVPRVCVPNIHHDEMITMAHFNLHTGCHWSVNHTMIVSLDYMTSLLLLDTIITAWAGRCSCCPKWGYMRTSLSKSSVHFVFVVVPVVLHSLTELGNPTLCFADQGILHFI